MVKRFFTPFRTNESRTSDPFISLTFNGRNKLKIYSDKANRTLFNS